MIGHAILFIVLPLAVAWLAGASAYFPPYPAPKTEPEIEPQFEAEVRTFLALHSEPGAAALRVQDRHFHQDRLGASENDRTPLAGSRLPEQARSLGRPSPASFHFPPP